MQTARRNRTCASARQHMGKMPRMGYPMSVIERVHFSFTVMFLFKTPTGLVQIID